MDLARKLKLALSNSGLSEEEIAFYLSVLKTPGSTIYDYAKKANLPKDRAYKIYESLENKHLVTPQNNERKHKNIIAAPINNYIEKLYSLGRKFYQTADSLKEVNPYLKYLNVSEESSMIKSLSSETIAEDWVDLSYLNWEEVTGYGNFELMVNAMGNAEPDQAFMKRRVRRGKKAYPILSEVGEYTKKMLLSRDYKELRDTKILEVPELKNSFVAIFPDLDLISMWSKDKEGFVTGAQIKDPTICRLHQSIFTHFSHMADET